MNTFMLPYSVSIHAYLHSQAHRHTHDACIHAYIHACIHPSIHSYMHACMHDACMRTCINKYTNTHTNLHTYPGIRLYDSDATWMSNKMEVSFIASRGSFTAPDITGLDFIRGDGTLDEQRQVFRCRYRDCQRAIRNIRYKSAEIPGSDVITLIVDDRGNSGELGALSASISITLSLASGPYNIPPIVQIPGLPARVAHPGSPPLFPFPSPSPAPCPALPFQLPTLSHPSPSFSRSFSRLLAFKAHPPLLDLHFLSLCTCRAARRYIGHLHR